MANKSYRDGDELIPGYQLQEYLGRGGFGEVWRATGPGGIQMALKIIRDLHRKKGGKELRALRLLKNIRHPNLVPLTGFWLKDNRGALVDEETHNANLDRPRPAGDESAQARGTLLPEASISLANVSLTDEAVELVIAMGLCEQSLFDRLEDCKLDNGRGIPPEELLTYLEDAARAIDLLNTRHGIQHCDIKPQNVLLLGGAAQVCDFGLATSIGDVRESSMGAGTIAYGAPEVLLGKGPSQATDQYSLAISYFELRTGQLPFSSERISDVLRAKQHGEIDLCLLPTSERTAVARATTIAPDERFPNCVELMRALRGSCSGDDVSAGVRIHKQSQQLVDTSAARSTEPEARPRSRHWSGFGALATALLTLMAVLATNPARLHPQASQVAIDDRSDSSVEVEAPAVRDAVPPSNHPAPSEDSPTGNASQDIVEVRPPLTESQIESRETPPKEAANELLSRHGAEVDSADVTATASDDSDTNAPPWQSLINLIQSQLSPPSTGDSGSLSTDPFESSISSTDKDTASSLEKTTTPQGGDPHLSELGSGFEAAPEQDLPATQAAAPTMEEVRKSLARTRGLGTSIRTPSSPTDFYHNARFYEHHGDYLNSRRCYARFLAYELDFIDPHIRFQRLVTMQEGRDAARRAYADILTTNHGPVARYAAILVQPDDIRKDRLAEFVHDHEDFAPAVYELSREFSGDRLGPRTLFEQAEERHLLEHFLFLVDVGHLFPHILDRGEGIRMVEDADGRLAEQEPIDPHVFENPVRMKLMMDKEAWIVDLEFAEDVREIRYRFPRDAEPESTGFDALVDPHTGSPSPRSFFHLPLEAEATPFFVMYTDMRGRERGPFELFFDPEWERILNGKRVLEENPPLWLRYREWDGRLIVYFTHLVAHRYAIEEIHYGVNTDELHRVFPLGPFDPHAPHRIPPGTETYITVPPDTEFVAVQIRYRDGKESRLQKFENRFAERPGTQHDDEGPPHLERPLPGNGPPGRWPPNRPSVRNRRLSPRTNGQRVLDNVDVRIDPNFRRPPRVKLGIGF